jgi:hypothetical protein
MKKHMEEVEMNMKDIDKAYTQAIKKMENNINLIKKDIEKGKIVLNGIDKIYKDRTTKTKTD